MTINFVSLRKWKTEHTVWRLKTIWRWYVPVTYWSRQILWGDYSDWQQKTIAQIWNEVKQGLLTMRKRKIRKLFFTKQHHCYTVFNKTAQCAGFKFLLFLPPNNATQTYVQGKELLNKIIFSETTKAISSPTQSIFEVTQTALKRFESCDELAHSLRVLMIC